MVFKYVKFFFFLFISFSFYFIAIFFWDNLWKELTNYVLFPLVFITLNYSFIKLILYYIRYYNNLIILHNDKIIVIKSTLLDTDNVELIDLNKTTKIDTEIKWILANIIWYWTLIIEQQSDKIREFWYVPKPYKAIWFLKDAKSKVSEKWTLIE